MQPLKDVSTMTTLDFASRFSNGDRALPSDLQALLLFLQEDISQHGQRPEAQDGGNAHHLIVIQAEVLFAIAKEDLNLPACGDMSEQGLGIGIEITRSPRACLCQWGRKLPTHDHDLAAIELAHRGGEHMHIDHLATSPAHSLAHSAQLHSR